MNSVIEQMLKQYASSTTQDKKNGIKEIVQEIVLCGLSRAGFFKKAAFYGGTALRIFYNLDRFSEDLDFSLKVPESSFSLNDYLPVLKKELLSYGLNFRIEIKDKSKKTDIMSAFLKGNTKEHIMLFYPCDELSSFIGKDELIKIKFEVDTNPPEFAKFETKYRLLPMPYEIGLYDMPSLFAGKIHAVICRSWKDRVKGRDLYDYVFYRSRNAKVNLAHLRARLVQSGYINDQEIIDIETVKRMLDERFEKIDYGQAKQDVIPFISNAAALDVWNENFFHSITEDLEAE